LAMLQLTKMDCCWWMLIGRAVMMVNIGLLAALENAIGHTEAHLTQLGAVIDECRSAGWRCVYHECLLLGAQGRLGRLRTRHAQELDDLAVLRYAGALLHGSVRP
jgi:hypothetical protein